LDDHQNIFRQDILCDFGRQLLPTHAIAEGHRNGALGGVLAHNIFVQLRDNLPRSHVVERGKKLLSLFGRGAVASGAKTISFSDLLGMNPSVPVPSSPLVPSYLRCEKNASVQRLEFASNSVWAILFCVLGDPFERKSHP